MERNRRAIEEKEGAIKDKERLVKQMDDERAQILERLGKATTPEEAYDEVCRILEEHAQALKFEEELKAR